MSELIHPEALQYFDRKPWAWRDPSHGEHYRTCSWCGSINPEDLAQELPHWTAEWADQKYGWPHKFYVKIPNREPDKIFVVGSSNSEQEGESWKKRDDLSEDELRAAEEYGYKDSFKWLLFSTRDYHFAKFYSIHLSDPAVDPRVKETIERRSGIQFTFADGRVTWGGVSDGNGGSQG